jgi:hypothetical protein
MARKLHPDEAAALGKQDDLAEVPHDIELFLRSLLDKENQPLRPAKSSGAGFEDFLNDTPAN